MASPNTPYNEPEDSDYDDSLNEIYYETAPIDNDGPGVTRCKQFSLGMLYLLWLNESMIALSAKDPNTLDPYTLFTEEFFDRLNPEVQAVTIQAFKNMATALEARLK